MDYPWLNGKAVLITGAGGGIGSAAAEAFLACGATVLGADLELSWADSLKRRIGAASSNLHAIRADVTDSNDVAAAVERMVSIHGTLDIAIAAAGIQAVGSTEDTPEEVWQRVMSINLTGTWLLCKHSVTAMKKGGGGTLLLLGSTAGLHPRANLAAYCVSKAGVSMLARVLGRETAADGIRVVAVCPTGTETPLLRGMIAGLEAHEAGADQVKAQMGAANEATAQADAGLMAGKPVQRWLEPAEVASVLTWLTSPAVSMVTGSSIPLDFGSV